MTLETDTPGEFGRRAEAPATTIVPKTASEALRPERGTPPPPPSRRSRGSRNQFVVFLNFCMSLIFLAVLIAGAAVYYGKHEFEAPGPLAQDTTVIIRPNTGVREIGQTLASRGIVTDPNIFWLGTRAHGADGELKAGEYAIKARSSMVDVMQVLQSGKSIMYSVTIPEGLTVEQAWQRIAQNEILVGDMPAQKPAEGGIAADTQRFTRGLTRTQVVNKLVSDQKKLVEEIWNGRASDLPVASVDEFLTLASIVEKETGIAEERPRVAAVFVNRLNKGMRLQSDPTIIYGLYGGKGKPADKPITQSDLKKQTPYNTYLINGLPPTPIAIPGRATLEAVANPPQTDDLYFVADGSGGHAFAKTLEEHNENVARWREIEKKKAEAAAAESGQQTTTGQ